MRGKKFNFFYLSPFFQRTFLHGLAANGDCLPTFITRHYSSPFFISFIFGETSP